jgi:tetratricopeptide (TPR) repeat protein
VNIDDPDGHCSGLLEHACDIHLAAARAAPPDPVRLARDLFAREVEGAWGTFAGAARTYAEVLGKRGLAEYRRLATEAWDKVPPRSGRARERDVRAVSERRLLAILDFFFERAGDVEQRIALRAKDLSSPWNYLQLAEFCRAQGREAEALRWAEEGLWIFADSRADERLIFLAADLLIKAGRKEDAEKHLWGAFEAVPTLETYERLRKLGGKSARQRALACLEARLAKRTAAAWRPADTLVRILMRETMLDAAWAASHKHAASMEMQEALARSSEATHPREALATYAKRVEQLANTGGDREYQETARIIARMATLRSAEEHAVYMTALKARMGRKRNLMKLLA